MVEERVLPKLVVDKKMIIINTGDEIWKIY